MTTVKQRKNGNYTIKNITHDQMSVIARLLCECKLGPGNRFKQAVVELLTASEVGLGTKVVGDMCDQLSMNFNVDTPKRTKVYSVEDLDYDLCIDLIEIE